MSRRAFGDDLYILAGPTMVLNGDIVISEVRLAFSLLFPALRCLQSPAVAFARV